MYRNRLCREMCFCSSQPSSVRLCVTVHRIQQLLRARHLRGGRGRLRVRIAAGNAGTCCRQRLSRSLRRRRGVHAHGHAGRSGRVESLDEAHRRFLRRSGASPGGRNAVLTRRGRCGGCRPQERGHRRCTAGQRGAHLRQLLLGFFAAFSRRSLGRARSPLGGSGSLLRCAQPRLQLDRAPELLLRAWALTCEAGKP